jgi:isocitrate/isopropylmalate dehydrogenase
LKYSIDLLPGDGVGPEFMEATVKVLKALENKTDARAVKTLASVVKTQQLNLQKL